MGAVNQLLAEHNVQVRRGRVNLHRDQGIVGRFNRTLAERLFGHQYAQGMLLAVRGSSERSAEWVARLPAVVTALNNEVTRLTGKKHKYAIRLETVAQKPSLPANQPVGLHEPLIPSDAIVRYLYASGELEGGRRRATDPNWSLTGHSVRNVVRQDGQPALYYLTDGFRAKNSKSHWPTPCCNGVGSSYVNSSTLGVFGVGAWRALWRSAAAVRSVAGRPADVADDFSPPVCRYGPLHAISGHFLHSSNYFRCINSTSGL